MSKILILDYGMGNLRSVAKKLHDLGVDFSQGATKELIEEADKIILPGVGHFGKAMSNLQSLNLIEPLNKAVLKDKKPILGICLGMQLMTKSSEEGNNDGLGWIDATVKKMHVSDTLKFKVPHTGWNTITKQKESRLLKGIDNNTEQYFVHAFYVECEKESDILTTTLYDTEFTSAFEVDNIFGVQFHPEKSHDIGRKIIENFINQ